jgi:phosphoglycolate phosphatase
VKVMIKAIIFDYDGVIVESFPTIYQIYKIICFELNKPCPSSIDDFRKLYGLTFIELQKNLGFSEEDSKISEKIYVKEIVKGKPKLFPEIKEVIKKLSEDYELIILSSNYEFEVKQKLEDNGILNYFSKIVGKVNETAVSFSKVDPIKEIMRENNFSPQEIVVIGDRDKDYFNAKEAGIDNIIIVEYGWGHTGKVPKQKTKVNSPKDLIQAIKALNGE